MNCLLRDGISTQWPVAVAVRLQRESWWFQALVTLKDYFMFFARTLSNQPQMNSQRRQSYALKFPVLVSRCSPTWATGHLWLSLGSKLWMTSLGVGLGCPRYQGREEAGNPISSEDWLPHFSWAVRSPYWVIGKRWQKFWHKWSCNNAGETERPWCYSRVDMGLAEATVSVREEFPCFGVRGCQHLLIQCVPLSKLVCWF